MTIKELKEILNEYSDDADVIIGVSKLGKYYSSIGATDMNTTDPETGESIKTLLLVV